MKNPKVSIIIPTWNGHQFLKDCLPSLERQTFTDFEIIVVDNGSIDESLSYIQKHHPQVEIIKLSQNIGFSPAVNRGIEKANGDYLVLINNDTKVDKDCLKFLVKAADEHPEVGMVAAKMLQFFSPDKIDSAGDYIDVVGHSNNIGMGQSSDKFNRAGYVFLVTGGGGLFKKQVFKTVGLFDEDYFAYYEDVDLCLRAQMQGFKGWFEPKAIIYHIHKATSSRNKPFTEYLQFRNMTQTIIKDFPNQLLLNPVKLLKILLVHFHTVFYLSTHGYLPAALKVEWFVLNNLPRLLKKRNKIQKQIKVDINEFIKNFRPKKITLYKILK